MCVLVKVALYLVIHVIKMTSDSKKNNFAITSIVHHLFSPQNTQLYSTEFGKFQPCQFHRE